jgi:long-chain acyl-CoA synthetase
MKEMGFAHFSQTDPRAVAVVDGRDVPWSRGEIFASANRLSRALRVAGLGSGEVIAVVAPNSLEFIVAYLAATQIGLYVVAVNWHLAPAEIGYILRDSAPRALIAHERFTSSLRAILEQEKCDIPLRIATGNAHGFVPVQEFVAGQPEGPLEEPIVGRAMVYTSATSGLPKAVQLSLDDAAQALERTIKLHVRVGIELGLGNVHLCASMLYHAGPLEATMIALHMGHVVVLVDRWDPERLLRAIDKYHVTTTAMAPAMFVRMLKLPEQVRRKYSVASLRRVVHTGAPCSVEVKRRMIAWWGPVLWDTYGAAEGAGTIVSSEEWMRYPGTVGRPIPGSEIRILDDQGEGVPCGEIGTIYLTRYAGDRFEYRGDPEKTRACHRGRFFTVGDLGYVNEDGYLFICDRKIDMILCGGANIYPAEIERVLVCHESVADCAVIGIPDPSLGEVPKAFVQLLPGLDASSHTKADILQLLSTHLSSAKLPREIEFVPDLPRSPNGKLYKRLLRTAEPRCLVATAPGALEK